MTSYIIVSGWGIKKNDQNHEMLELSLCFSPTTNKKRKKKVTPILMPVWNSEHIQASVACRDPNTAESLHTNAHHKWCSATTQYS